MTLKDDMASDMSVFFDSDDFAETGTYMSRAEGASGEVRVIMDYGGRDDSDIGNAVSRRAVAHIPREDLPNDPRNLDTLTVSGVEWTVVKQIGGDNLVVSLALRFDQRNRYK